MYNQIKGAYKLTNKLVTGSGPGRDYDYEDIQDKKTSKEAPKNSKPEPKSVERPPARSAEKSRSKSDERPPARSAEKPRAKSGESPPARSGERPGSKPSERKKNRSAEIKGSGEKPAASDKAVGKKDAEIQDYPDFKGTT